jgi:hypothetical protein
LRNGAIEKRGVRNPIKLRPVKPGQIELDSDLYYRCAALDGLRLEGAWTSYAAPEAVKLTVYARA